jgi:hypothetical protein
MMATSGTIQGTTKNSSGTDITAQYKTWITWKRNSTNIANNTSNITVTVYVQRADGYTDSAWNLEDKPTVTLKVGGSAKTVTTNYVDTRNNKLCTITSWTDREITTITKFLDFFNNHRFSIKQFLLNSFILLHRNTSFSYNLLFSQLIDYTMKRKEGHKNKTPEGAFCGYLLYCIANCSIALKSMHLFETT